MSIQPYIGDAAVGAYCDDAIKPVYVEAKQAVDSRFPIWSGRAVYDHAVGALSWPASCAKHLRECREALGLSAPPSPPVAALTPLRVEQGRLRNDHGWLHWRGLSEFSALHLVRTGSEGELIRRLDRAQACGRNGIRVLMMARNMFDLAPSMVGYWLAADRMVALAEAHGLYVEACLFADAQDVMPDAHSRQVLTLAFAAWCREHPTVFPQLCNEPFKNGFTGATDPELLALADQFAANYGKPFSIGDPQDVVDDKATGEPLRGALTTLGQRSAVLVLHGERKAQDARWAPWVDHLKGFDEVYHNGTGTYRIHDEPMGAASVTIDARRDSRGEAHLAAALVCAVMGVGFTYHYISEQDDATPGLERCVGQMLVPASPDFIFRNAGTPGACVVAFEPGLDKIRTCDNGHEAWAVGYGHAPAGVTWAAGWSPQIITRTEHVILWMATR